MSFNNIEEVSDRHLHIIWTSGDPVTAEHMILMFATNGMLNQWWDKITVVLWGSAQKLLLENASVRLKKEMAEQTGVEFSACISCAMNLGTVEALEKENIEVIRWGEKLSLLMQNDKHVLTI